MTRNGKIARLPRALREELNRRLANGTTGARLVGWLNDLPEVRAVLDSEFGGTEITEQNLSVWKQGGFQDWERHQEARSWVSQLVEQSEDLELDSGNIRLAERASTPVIVELFKLLTGIDSNEDPEKRRRAVFGIAQHLAKLRNADYDRERVRLESERWERKKEEVREAKRDAEKFNARWERVRTALLPHLDADGLPLGAGGLCPEFRPVIELNNRLRQEQSARAGSGQIQPDSSKSK